VTLEPNLPPQPSGTYAPGIIEDIQVKAELGRYRIRGFGILRPRTWATFDDLTFIPCGLTRIPLEGYRESCSTKTVLGTRFAREPLELDIPVMITGMSFGALSYNAKVALSRVSPEIARMRDLPPGVDQRSPCRHPDFLGPDDMILKIEELREATDWRVPIFVKLGASRVFDDVKLAAKAGADVVVIDGMEGGTGASPELLQEHTGIPTLAAVCEARAALESLRLYGVVQLIIAGGLRHGSDMAKALALGADAVYVGTAALIALNCNKPLYLEDYHAIGASPYHCHHCHTGRCPVGITTQDPELTKRLEIDPGAERVANWLHAVTSEIQILARACGKRDVHDLEPEDLRALTLEASLITGVPLAGTNVVFGGGPGWSKQEKG
jgi:glutamate synthase domain-containing protein 2